MSQGGQFGVSQLVQLAQQAGWSADEAPKIAAIAMAESGGRSGALNDNPATGDRSYGLTQVNMIGGLGPARLKQFGLSSNEDLFDPITNLRAAKAIRDSQGWNAWSVYRSGKHAQYLPGAQQAAAAGGGATPGGGGADPSGFSLASLLAPPEQTPAAPKPSGQGFNIGAIAAAGLAPIGAATGAQRFAAEAPGIADALSAVFSDSRPQTTAPASAAPSAGGVLPAIDAAVKGDGDSVDLVSFGRELQRQGLRVGQHPAFGPVGKHSQNSWHYKDRALDITDWNDGSWKARKKHIGDVARSVLGNQAEIFHPGYDPVGGHHEHIHFALPSGRLPRAAANRILAGVQEAFSLYPKG